MFWSSTGTLSFGFQNLIIGSSTKNQVKKNLGEPLMIDNHNEETWIYFSQKIEKIAFFAPRHFSTIDKLSNA